MNTLGEEQFSAMEIHKIKQLQFYEMGDESTDFYKKVKHLRMTLKMSRTSKTTNRQRLQGREEHGKGRDRKACVQECV